MPSAEIPDNARWGRAAIVASLVIAAIVGIAALWPPSPRPPGPPAPDKLLHFLSFAAIILPIALYARRHLLTAMVLAIAYGGLIEVIQPFTGRGMEAMDLVADIAGVLAGALVALPDRFRQRRQTAERR